MLHQNQSHVNTHTDRLTRQAMRQMERRDARHAQIIDEHLAIVGSKTLAAAIVAADAVAAVKEFEASEEEAALAEWIRREEEEAENIHDLVSAHFGAD